MINETLTAKSECAILLKVEESDCALSPAGLGVGGDEVEDEAHHHAGRHDDAGVGEDGRVDGQQT